MFGENQMYDMYLVWDNRAHKPVILVKTLEQAKSYCENHRPYGWKEYSNNEMWRFEVHDGPYSVLDFKIFKVMVVGDA